LASTSRGIALCTPRLATLVDVVDQEGDGIRAPDRAESAAPAIGTTPAMMAQGTTAAAYPAADCPG
jgi:hypothetical protein